MRYMGSKARHAKHIVPFLMDGHDPQAWYIEPFMGGGNMLSNVPVRYKWGNDTAEYAVALLEAVSKGWEPPSVLTQDEYYDIKESPDKYDPALVGFAAYCCSYGGKFWGGYARNKPEEGGDSTIPAQQVRNLIKQRPGLTGTKFTCMSYLDLDIPDNSTVYCDPPYASTTGYGGDFDHVVFWEWATDLSRRCRVFVSEYSAPDEWKCIWEKTVSKYVTKKDDKYDKATEKLFIFPGSHSDQTTDLFS